MFSVLVVASKDTIEDVEVSQVEGDGEVSIIMVFENYHDVLIKAIDGKLHIIYTADSGTVDGGMEHTFPLKGM